MSILSIAYYTAIKYLRNPLALIAFIAAPIIVIFILTSSTEYEELKPNMDGNINQSHIEKSENANLEVTIIKTNGTLRVKDKVSMASMLIFIFYGSLLTSHSIISDLKKNTHIRFKASPIRFIENYLGKSLGHISLMALSTFVIFIVTKYVYGVNWSGNPIIILLVLLLFLIIVNSFGIITTGFTKNIYISALATFAINFSMIFGSMSEAFGPIPKDSIMHSIMKLSIHNYALKTIYGTITDNTMVMQTAFTTLALISGGMMIISYMVGRRVLK